MLHSIMLACCFLLFFHLWWIYCILYAVGCVWSSLSKDNNSNKIVGAEGERLVRLVVVVVLYRNVRGV